MGYYYYYYYYYFYYYYPGSHTEGVPYRGSNHKEEQKGLYPSTCHLFCLQVPTEEDLWSGSYWILLTSFQCCLFKASTWFTT